MSRWWYVDKTFRATMTYVEIHSPASMVEGLLGSQYQLLELPVHHDRCIYRQWRRFPDVPYRSFAIGSFWIQMTCFREKPGCSLANISQPVGYSSICDECQATHTACNRLFRANSQGSGVASAPTAMPLLCSTQWTHYVTSIPPLSL